MSELTKHCPAKWSHSSGYKNTRHGNKNIVLPVNPLFSLIYTTFQNRRVYLCIFTHPSPSFGLLEYLLLSPVCPGAKNFKKQNTHAFWSKNNKRILIKCVPFQKRLAFLLFSVWFGSLFPLQSSPSSIQRQTLHEIPETNRNNSTTEKTNNK